MKRLFLLPLVALLYWIYPSSDQGFSKAAIDSPRAMHFDGETRPITEDEQNEAIAALSQPYHYLACGNQAFAFESEDGRYVVKFLKKKLFNTHRFWDSKERWKKGNKRMRDFASYCLAFNALKEETALCCVHLNPTSWLPKALNLTDEQGKHHRLNPNAVSFILQHKADLVYPTIDRLMEEGRIDDAKRALSSLMALLATRAAKGIADSDPDLDKNFGFIDGKAVQIDIGRFSDRPLPTRYRDRNLPKNNRWEGVPFPPIKPSFTQWLADHHPALLEHLIEERDQVSPQTAFLSEALLP